MIQRKEERDAKPLVTSKRSETHPVRVTAHATDGELIATFYCPVPAAAAFHAGDLLHVETLVGGERPISTWRPLGTIRERQTFVGEDGHLQLDLSVETSGTADVDEIPSPWHPSAKAAPPTSITSTK